METYWLTTPYVEGFMFKSRKPLVAPVCAAAVVGLFGSSALFASTGNFSSPLTNAILSVDVNGGPLNSASATTEGWNGSGSMPADNPDPYGVTWSPWGGQVASGGDGTQLHFKDIWICHGDREH
jgi:hypothetical protein